MRTRTDLARAAARSGLRLVAVRPNALGELDGTFAFDNPWSAAHLLTHLSEEDATREDLGGTEPTAWALAILDACRRSVGDDRVVDCFARAVQRSVQQAIAFVSEEGERFQSPRTTMATGKGDCDCQARLVYTLARRAGLPAALVYFDDARRVRVIRPGDPVPKDDGSQPVHVAPLLMTSGGWGWSETTIPASFGEEPYTAYRRLKAQGHAAGRDDLEG